jgi:hypothetical protein
MPEKPAAITATPAVPPAAELSFEGFWQNWGETCGFAEEAMRRIWDFSEEHHTDLPAHNFNHAKQTLWRSMGLVSTGGEPERPANHRTAVGSALLHTIAFSRPIKNSGHASRQERAAYCASKNAQRLGYRPTEFAALKRTIASLQPDKKITFLGDAILARASLSSAGGNYETVFLPWLNDLREEAELLGGDESDVRSGLALVLAKTASPALSGSPDFHAWSQQAIANVGQTFSHDASERGVPMAEYLKNIGTSAIGRLLDMAELGAVLLPATTAASY